MSKTRKFKLQAIEYYGGKCIRCGYSKCAAALSFHHRDRATKKYEPSWMIPRVSLTWEEKYQELDKCDLVCLNCHHEIHEEERLALKQ
jgi:hypothetical protein